MVRWRGSRQRFVIGRGRSYGGDAVVRRLLFQMTMPVTLAAIALVSPQRPGLAFGLTTLALILGLLPTFTQAATRFYGPGMFLALIVASAVSVYVGLKLLGDRSPIRGILSARRA